MIYIEKIYRTMSNISQNIWFMSNDLEVLRIHFDHFLFLKKKRFLCNVDLFFRFNNNVGFMLILVNLRKFIELILHSLSMFSFFLVENRYNAV